MSEAPAAKLEAPAAPSPAPALRPPLLERLGMQYFRRRTGMLPGVQAADAVHYLNPQERAGLRRVERGAVLRACVAGAISSGVAALAEVLATPLLGANAEAAGFGEQLRYWAVVGGVTVLMSVAEVLFLYWDSLRAVHELSRVAGLELFPEDQEQEAVAAALARAALELPNPNCRVFGVDPRREASRLRLLVATLVYKLKVSVSNFVLKIVVRRVMGRAALRTALVPFVAVPVTAAWNGIVSFLVMRQARLRAIGPSATQELVEHVLGKGPALSAAGQLAAIRAVASAVVRTRDFHPNHLALLRQVIARCPLAAQGEHDDVAAFIQLLGALALSERRVVVQVLTIAAIADGRLTQSERRLLEQAQDAAGLPVDSTGAERLRRAFVRGEEVLPHLARDFEGPQRG